MEGISAMIVLSIRGIEGEGKDTTFSGMRMKLHKKNSEKPEKCVKKAKNRLKLKEMETILRLKKPWIQV